MPGYNVLAILVTLKVCLNSKHDVILVQRWPTCGSLGLGLLLFSSFVFSDRAQ